MFPSIHNPWKENTVILAFWLAILALFGSAWSVWGIWGIAVVFLYLGCIFMPWGLSPQYPSAIAAGIFGVTWYYNEDQVYVLPLSLFLWILGSATFYYLQTLRYLWEEAKARSFARSFGADFCARHVFDPWYHCVVIWPLTPKAKTWTEKNFVKYEQLRFGYMVPHDDLEVLHKTIQKESALFSIFSL